MAKKPHSLTKADVAARQIETAIRLWFEDADPVAIHTLAAASHRIIQDVLKARGESTVIGGVTLATKAMEKKYFNLVHGAANFFKHADKDHAATYEFNPEQTLFHLYDAVQGYRRLTGGVSSLMMAYSLRFILTRPRYFPAGFLPVGQKEVPIEELRVLSKKHFLKYFDL